MYKSAMMYTVCMAVIGVGIGTVGCRSGGLAATPADQSLAPTARPSSEPMPPARPSSESAPSSEPIRAEVELPHGEKITLKDVRILDHGAPMDAVMFWTDEGQYDINAMIGIKDIASIRKISDVHVEFTFTNGGRKKWKLEGRGVVGTDAESLFTKRLMFSDVMNINFLK
jgi:hypothetical protein